MRGRKCPHLVRERKRERERGGKKKTFLLMTFPVGLAEGEIKDRRFIEM